MGSHGGDLAAIETLNQLRNTTYATSLAAYALFFGAVGLAAFVARSLPKWLSVSAVVIAAWLGVGVAFFADGQADLPGMAGPPPRSVDEDRAESRLPDPGQVPGPRPGRPDLQGSKARLGVSGAAGQPISARQSGTRR
jgi:hypothetical protein